MLENRDKETRYQEVRYKEYGDWDVRQLELIPFLKAVPLCMLLSLPIGIWLTKNSVLWLVIGALVGVVVACEEIYEKRNFQQKNFQQGEGGAST